MKPDRTRLVHGVLAGVVGVAAVLRFAGIGDRSLWIDEAFSVWLAEQPLAAAWATTISVDMHPPLYYSLLHLWMIAGSGEAVARSLSAVLSTLTVPICYLIGTRIGGRTLGLVTAGLIALSPLQVYYAQQARMYSMLTFFAALSVLSLLRLLDARPPPDGAQHPGPWWVCFVLSTALAMLSHNAAILLPATLAIFVVMAGAAWPRQRLPLFVGLPGVVTGLAGAFVVWLPWLPTFLHQTERVDAEFWLPAPTADTVVQHWRTLALAYGPEGTWVLPTVAVVAFLTVFGAWSLRRRPLIPYLLLLLVLAPVTAELVISLRRPIFYTQTLVWTAVPLCVLVSAGLLRLRPPPLAAAGCAVVVAFHIGALAGYARDPGFEDWRAAAGYVATHAEPGDLLLFNAGWTTIPFGYYWTRDDAPPVVQRGLPADLFERGVLEPKMAPSDLPRLDTLTVGRTHVWLIYSHDWYTDPARLIPARLTGRFGPAQVREFAGVQVYRYGTARQ